jgi:hypothetical protein
MVISYYLRSSLLFLGVSMNGLRQTLVAAVIFWGLVQPIFSQENSIPPKIQAAFFGKIFSNFDPVLKGKNPVLCVVVYDTDQEKNEMVAAFQEVGFTVRAVKSSQPIGEADIVYFAGKTKVSGVQGKNIVSVSNSIAQVESGSAVMGLGLENSKPKIHINLNAAKTLGRAYPAALLKLAKVY